MDEAVKYGKQAVEQMASAPPPIEPLSSAIVAVTSATAELASNVDNWGSLLRKVERFTTIVDGIAEVRNVTNHTYSAYTHVILLKVHPYAKMAWSVLSAVPKVCLIK